MNILKHNSRRDFLLKSFAASLGLAAGSLPFETIGAPQKNGMQFGLVTYQWGRDWDLPTLIKNCESAGILGVELRTQHAHGVETSLSGSERLEVKKRFEDSPVTCLGYGSNFEYHSPDPKILRDNIQQTKAYIQLCQDIGATGIKVKPNTLPADVPKEKTIAQIASSFNEVGKFAGDYGQLVRVEVHGHLTQELPVMKAIFDQVTDPNVKICWNCNPEDLNDPGLEANFNSVKKWFGDTVHVREFNEGDYPYQELFDLFAGMDYQGWILMEARTEPNDRVEALKEQLQLFKNLRANSLGIV
ncbi:sugar phosphate isomerase/epimerase family protein [Algoriphagus machipongonensis]|uniref:Tat (Twin-arginine translocation) pathway signal sequence containing protein n=1 Tax=Algoriphagus machipongonensis TaxID=388413 RepID=A3HSI0_9BACT|nr:sugar phosphate isomerase/epimerase family protein [Algoriphagus machipongonensis]EAZ82798.1 putative Tat (twin-arginine translocation) pathway signal sequence containing protein [Algoriphagus machipongonensis]